ncbi:hypothetical protein HPS36_03705 [Halorubrum salinarum]|uniref:Uncharacterized protein n=1 Tax=Halorubrum salinarum TaxID=2739057 RepID=A0A7D4CRK9_9EURY|nr:hypothetical protein [Halorubrum salinarum]QKG91999.1 hypothetical protein HPS36_03705 [Halorubrum salinarum]
MVKRRSMVVGLGALATGSGAVFSSAALQSTSASTAAFQVYTVQELNVTRGSTEYDQGDTGISISDASDLPQAHVTGDTQSDSLNVNVATRNSASNQSLTHLLDVENNGTEPVSVGFGFSTFGTIVVDGDNTTAGDGQVTEKQVQGMYSFQVNTTDSNGISSDDGTDISPGSSSQADAPQNYKQIPAGATLAIDLVVDAPDPVVKAINQAANPSGNPFDVESRAKTTLVQEIVVGTETDLTTTN